MPNSPGLMIEDPHSRTIEAVLAATRTDPGRGLTTAEAISRRQRYGNNELPTARREPAWRHFATQFHQLVVWILIVAAVIAGVTGDALDTVVILAIVLLNAILGFVQEERAERALESLKNLSLPMARVRRDGDLDLLPAAELVPGDIVSLEAGDHVPADCRLIEAYAELTIQEAALTGESSAVVKDAHGHVAGAASLADRTNMAYFGTSVTTGKGSAAVVATGSATELGKIAGMLAREQREPTPLQRRLASLGRVLVAVCLGIVALIAALLLARGLPLSEVLLPAISLAVAAVPEKVFLRSSRWLSPRPPTARAAKCMVRKLPSVETLGSVNVICSDKTGTLTRNEMTVRELMIDDRRYRFSGGG